MELLGIGLTRLLRQPPGGEVASQSAADGCDSTIQLRLAQLISRTVEDVLVAYGPALGLEARRHIDVALQETRHAIGERDAGLADRRAQVLQLALDMFTSPGGHVPHGQVSTG